MFSLASGDYMVDTTDTRCREQRPSDSSEAGAPEIEITPAMIEAGVDAYYRNAGSGWENSGHAELKAMVSAIFSAMWFCSHPKTN